MKLSKDTARHLLATQLEEVTRAKLAMDANPNDKTAAEEHAKAHAAVTELSKLKEEPTTEACKDKIYENADYILMKRLVQSLEGPQAAMVLADSANNLEAIAAIFYAGANAVTELSSMGEFNFDSNLSEGILEHLQDKDARLLEEMEEKEVAELLS